MSNEDKEELLEKLWFSGISHEEVMDYYHTKVIELNEDLICYEDMVNRATKLLNFLHSKGDDWKNIAKLIGGK